MAIIEVVARDNPDSHTLFWMVSLGPPHMDARLCVETWHPKRPWWKCHPVTHPWDMQ